MNTRQNSLVSRIVIAAAATTFGAMSASSPAQTPTSKFGTQWPPLGKCLEYSDDTGAWGWKRAIRSAKSLDEKSEIIFGEPKIYFLKGGEFVIGWPESEYERNEFFRRREKTPEHVVKLTGTWTLEYRQPLPPEKELLGIDKRLKFNVYFLDLTFVHNKIPADYGNYPDLKEVKVNGRLLLVLNEFQPYKRDRRSKPTFTTPDNLLWLVAENSIGSFLMPSTVVKNRLLIMRHR